jgi:hypothetical protein
MRRTAYLALCVLGLFPAAARADRAVVVGINKYPRLFRANLRGAVNDATEMADALRRYGFEVTVITNDDAEKLDILGELAQAAADTKKDPRQRFVFYFSGQGTNQRGGAPVLLPYDARPETGANDLTPQELYDAVSSIPARSHSIIIDANNSGGMTIVPSGSRTGGGAAPTCYLTSCRDNELAVEDTFGDVRRGVFSYYLANALKSPQKEAGVLTWADVHRRVADQMAVYLKDRQHPILSGEFAQVPLFEDPRSGAAPAGTTDATPRGRPGLPGAARGPIGPVATRDLWDELEKGPSAPGLLRVSMIPNRPLLTLGETLAFEARTGMPGYLIIVERGADERYNLLFPESRKVQDAWVQARSIISVPDKGDAFQASVAGVEQVRAYLFNSRSAAETFLEHFPEGRPTYEAMRSALQGAMIAPAPLYRSEYTFEVGATVGTARQP